MRLSFIVSVDSCSIRYFDHITSTCSPNLHVHMDKIMKIIKCIIFTARNCPPMALMPDCV